MDTPFQNPFFVTLYSDARVGVVPNEGDPEQLWAFWKGQWSLEEEV
jgi:hypothetical protein